MYQPQGKAKQLNQQQDRIWILAMATLAVFMVVVVAWRWFQDRQPPSEKYGVALLELEPAGGQAVVPFDLAPVLTMDGGVLAIDSGAIEAFVVRIGPDAYNVFARRTAQGRRVKYDITNGIFVDRKDPNVGFDRATGACLTQGVEDQLIKYTSRANPVNLEIQPVAQ